MFTRIQHLLQTLFTDMQSTFIWAFIIGGLVCGLMIWQGDEQNAPKFKKGLLFCGAGVVVFLLAKPFVDYIKAGL
ncbi:MULTISPECIES: hypothetical protein [Bacillus]|jgi:stage V sporulation protein AE|uniref:Uncharacterized protein n=8 Tax=Bacillus cereus group TaxID=86661 RepID=A0A9X6KSC2_BACTU|nr:MULTISPECIES: hypothetical protein [Bacillus]ACI30587.1 conserved hypothetical protein [Bacillus cereus H3081.97]AKR38743.1 Hypothetical protein NF53_p4095 [Bacillus thuringiensis serovar indiana]EOP80569.1 hypothetical protein IES_06355 [Bacillus cereus BMG1.7]OTY74358.1 hypothetical protein BK753_00200 [Bacillus thuringiensis serovar canadensis]ADU03125.1 hypothetical protein pBMB0558_00295 [Bacillus thuringiensis serovar chinensis CT-43]